MINKSPSVPVPVVPVIFLMFQHSLYLYITIYISISYIVYIRVSVPHFLIGTIGTGTLRPSFTFYFFTFLPFLYKVFEYVAQLIGHLEGIAVDAEILVGLQGLEVQAQHAVFPTGNRDQLTIVDAGIALRGPGQGLDERVVGVAAAKALVSLYLFH